MNCGHICIIDVEPENELNRVPRLLGTYCMTADMLHSVKLAPFVAVLKSKHKLKHINLVGNPCNFSCVKMVSDVLVEMAPYTDYLGDLISIRYSQESSASAAAANVLVHASLKLGRGFRRFVHPLMED